MQSIRRSSKSLVYLFTTCFLFLSCYIPAVQAGIVSTESLIDAQADREKVAVFLSREDVQTQLVKQGVNPIAALQRIDRLTDSEIASLADRIDTLPAGGDALGVALIVFLVLLITDIAGVTDIFPFVKKNR